ncbi:hypothetical protein JTE90_020840 [Oedothorax gibbosus]|uniref:Uncharacterized protein n=1 Tax=Oedothorax gibbosus TaxID=931172 RepID=A0AAV6UQF9_9ARAC|nr:hypothetical protein JTE90_020840 [Oedothorax gibbosus]
MDLLRALILGNKAVGHHFGGRLWQISDELRTVSRSSVECLIMCRLRHLTTIENFEAHLATLNIPSDTRTRHPEKLEIKNKQQLISDRNVLYTSFKPSPLNGRAPSRTLTLFIIFTPPIFR